MREVLSIHLVTTIIHFIILKKACYSTSVVSVSASFAASWLSVTASREEDSTESTVGGFHLNPTSSLWPVATSLGRISVVIIQSIHKKAAGSNQSSEVPSI